MICIYIYIFFFVCYHLHTSLFRHVKLIYLYFPFYFIFLFLFFCPCNYHFTHTHRHTPSTLTHNMTNPFLHPNRDHLMWIRDHSTQSLIPSHYVRQLSCPVTCCQFWCRPVSFPSVVCCHLVALYVLCVTLYRGAIIPPPLIWIQDLTQKMRVRSKYENSKCNVYKSAYILCMLYMC